MTPICSGSAIPAAWTAHAEIACAGRNELPTQRGITVVEAKAYCEGESTCVSFERMPTSGHFQFSTSCTPYRANRYSNHELYVIGRSADTAPAATWTQNAGIACAGRNELPTKRNINVVIAKAYCEGESTCVSFERMPTSGHFQFSTSCTPSFAAAYSNHDLYTISR